MRFFILLTLTLPLLAQEVDIRKSLSEISGRQIMTREKAEALNGLIRSEAEENAYAALLSGGNATLSSEQQTILIRALGKYSARNVVVRKALLDRWTVDPNSYLVDALAPAASDPIVKEKLLALLEHRQDFMRSTALHAPGAEINEGNEGRVAAAYDKNRSTLFISEIDPLALFLQPNHPALTDLFIRLLDHPDMLIQTAAAEGLRAVVGEKKVRNALIAAVEKATERTDWAFVRLSLYSLRDYGWDPDVRRVLFKSLSHEHHSVRVVAIVELYKYAERFPDITDRLVTQLIEFKTKEDFLDEPHPDYDEIGLLQGVLIKRGNHNANEEECSLLAHTVMFLWRQADSILPRLDAALARRSPSLCGGVYEAADRLDSFHSDKTGRLRSAVSHESASVRKAALKHLKWGSSSAQKTVAELSALLGSETVPAHRLEILSALGRGEGEDAVNLLVQAYRSDKDEEVRLKALQLLCAELRFGAPSKLREDTVFEALASTNGKYATLALQSLYECYSIPRFRSRIQELAKRTEPRMRHPAIQILAAWRPEALVLEKSEQ